ncbi:MAG: redoxin domain-containing protein [Bacteroidales bacterium]
MDKVDVSQVFQRVAAHEFNPLNEDRSLTVDYAERKAGIPDLDNEDWRIRLLGVRDLVRAGQSSVDEIIEGLKHKDEHVRQVCAMALGILSAEEGIEGLEQLALEDSITVVRSQAIISLGQIESIGSLDLLNKILVEDPSRDVMHQCELAIDQIEKQMGTSPEQLDAFLSLDEATFESVGLGDKASDFELEDTQGEIWKLSDFEEENWVVLIWVFADWCPVCHGEFHDLMDMHETFEKEGIKVFTLEIHDKYRGRVMVGKELEPSYWFAKESFKEAYTNRIKWPHLLDRAGAVGARYGIDPLAFAVHAEYINRPSTVIVDKEGIVRFLYLGTYWGDRPTIEETLEMIRNEDFEFEHPNRRK